MAEDPFKRAYSQERDLRAIEREGFRRELWIWRGITVVSASAAATLAALLLRKKDGQ